MCRVMLFSVLVLVVVPVVVTDGDEKTRRILMSDPTYIQQELHQIQVKLQEYEATKSDVVTLQTKLANQETKLANQEFEMSSLQTKLTSQESEMSSLQTKLTNQESEISSLQTNLTYQESQIQDLLTRNQLMEQHLTKVATKGVVYVRWGRKDCAGNGTELVYSGIAGGSWFSSAGAATDYVCLPRDPTWGPHKDIRSYVPALMYGAEYEDTVLFGMPNTHEEVPFPFDINNDPSQGVVLPGLGSGVYGKLGGGLYRRSGWK